MENSQGVQIKCEPMEFVQCDADFKHEFVKVEQDSEDILDNPDFVHIDNSESVEGHLQCLDCEKIFAEQPQLNLHSMLHQVDGARECPVCSKSSFGSKGFAIHIQNHLRQYSRCPFCPEYFFSTKYYSIHVAQHKRNEKLYCCSFCEKKFFTPKELAIHERVHTNERPFPCPICKKGFKQRGSLKLHVENVHNEQKNHKCEQCGGFFATSSSLTRHQKRIHDQGKSIVCKVCGDVFFNHDAFQKHSTEKHPEKKYFRICPVCGEAFFNKRCYEKHGKTHPNWKELMREKQINRLNQNSKAVTKKESASVLNNNEKIISQSDTEENKADFLGPFSNVKTEKIISQSDTEEMKADFLESISNVEKAFNDDSSDDIPLKEVLDPMKPKTPLKRKASNLFVDQIEPINNIYSNKQTSYNKGELNEKVQTDNDCLVNNEFNTKIDKDSIKMKKIRRDTESEADPVIEYRCNDCGLVFSNRDIFKLHYTVHRYDNSIVNMCPICDKTFTIERFYAGHIERHIEMFNKNCVPTNHENLADDDCESKCPECKKTFPNKIIADLHYGLHKFQEGMQCYCCFKTYAKFQNYSAHIKNVIDKKMTNLIKPDFIELELIEGFSIKCPTCEEEFGSQDILDLHLTIHNPSKSKNLLKCVICSKTYSAKSHYADHIQRHIKNCIRCKLCSKVCFCKRDFLLHKKSHNESVHNKQCHYCPEVFARWYKRDMHECKAHGVENGRRYNCPRCQKTFFEARSLRVHMAKPHSCQLCDKKFCLLTMLMKHKKTEHPSDFFECPKCNSNFSNIGDFRMHFLRKHRPESSQATSSVNAVLSDADSNGSHLKDTSESD